MGRTTNEKGQILCYGCKQPIHIDHFAGAVMTDDGEEFVCDALPCLLAVKELGEENDSSQSD
jgi:hypothetical protein